MPEDGRLNNSRQACFCRRCTERLSKPVDNIRSIDLFCTNCIVQVVPFAGIVKILK